jgi:hypothetical protein
VLSRREFLTRCGVLFGAAALHSTNFAGDSGHPAKSHDVILPDWRDLLDDYVTSTRNNIVVVNGRRAVLSSRLYPGTYIRDGLFWGPLALDDPALGYESYQWFAETQLDTGQIRSAVPLNPDEVAQLLPQDDEGSLLFVIASDWLNRHGYPPNPDQVVMAYAWAQGHVQEDTYISPSGPFRYWADTVNPETADAIAYNQGLLCLARRAMVNLGLGGISEDQAAAAQTAYRGFYNATLGYVTLGLDSRFASAQDISAVFPEFLSRYLYGEPLLTDEMVVNHVRRIVNNAAVSEADGKLAGIKIISAASGDFLPQDWYFASDLNPPGDYQNGGYWPMYTNVALALAYKISGDAGYGRMIGQLVENELAGDHQSKEIIRLTPGAVGTFEAVRANYTWNALIRTACIWCGLA